MFQIRSKIFRKLFTALVLIAVIPVCIMGYQAYGTAQRALTGTAFTHMATVAAGRANHLNSWFNERLDDIRVLSEIPTVRELSRQYCSAQSYETPSPKHAQVLTSVMVLTQKRSPAYEGIHIISLTGEIIASTNPDSEVLSNVRKLPVFERLSQNKDPVLSSIYPSAGHTLRLILLARVQMPGVETVAFVLAVLDISKMLDPIMTDRAGLGETGETYLVNKEGKIITVSRHLSREATFDQSFDSFGIRQALNRKNGTAIYRNYAAHEVVGAYLWIPPFDWALIGEMDKHEIMEPLVGIKAIVILTAIVVSFLCFLLALTVTRQVSRPIVRMSQAAREMAQGHLNQRIPYSGEDEIGTLAASFNTMTQKLSSLVITSINLSIWMLSTFS